MRMSYSSKVRFTLPRSEEGAAPDKKQLGSFLEFLTQSIRDNKKNKEQAYSYRAYCYFLLGEM